MSKINELVEKLCPNGVEYKTIGEIATYRRGSFPQPYTNSSFYGGEDSMPFVQVADIEDKGFMLKEKTKQTISKIAQPKSIFVPKGSIICSIQGTIGRVAITQYDAYVDRTIAIFDGFKININKRFFAYCIQVKFGIEKQYARGSTLKTITKEEFTKFCIPVPPMEVQNEIVHILDDFTLLSAELSAELKARQEQYNYYKELLLNTNGEHRKLSDVADIIDSLHATPSYVENGYPMIRVADVKEGYIDTKSTLKVDENTYRVFIKRYKPQYNDIIISRVGSFGNFSLVPDEDVCLGQNVALIHPKINNKYLYYYLKSKPVLDYVNKNARGGGYKNIGIKDIIDIPVMVPDIQEQNRIADMLDKFYKLANDISTGLPAEIEARQKQYEYYRDKLLTFKELVNEE